MNKIKTTQELQQELDNLKAFANAVMNYWPESGVDGDDLQELAAKHGLLKPEIRHKSCAVENVSVCQCAEYYSEMEFYDGVECLRKTELLK